MKWGGEQREDAKFLLYIIIGIATCVSIAFMLGVCWLALHFIAS